tara:strand:- start:2290 stop:2787 length:498 start_codon:yes stop_codon:yes gene_type:complete
MPIADFVFISLAIFSSLLGLSRGFIKEFLSLSKWLLSLYISLISFEKTKIILSGYLKDTAILDLIAGVSAFLLSFLILSIIFNFLSKILSIKGIDFIDKTLGCFFGFLRMVLIFSLLFIIYTDIFYNLERPAWFNDSYSIKYIEKTSNFFKQKFLEFNSNNDIIT